MKLKFTFLISLSFVLVAARPPDTDALMERGILLYRLEKASWYGTDNFLANFPDMVDSIGGYLSYVDEDNDVVNIFFNQSIPAKILVRFTFESTPNMIPINVDTENNDPTEMERELIGIRQDAIRRINADTAGFFTIYKNTSLNPIPLIKGRERLVYILTATQEDGYLLLGNDYLMTYNRHNLFRKKSKIHAGLLQYPYRAKEGEDPLVSTVHSHIISDVIDVTDICTLLLYRDYLQWKQHYVLSDKYISLLDLEKEQLLIMKRKKWDKLQENIQKQKE